MYSPDKMKPGGGLMAPPGCFPARYSPTYRSPDPRRCVPNPSSRILEETSLMCNSWSPRHNGDLFSGLNDGLLSRAEALAAVDIGKHQGGSQAGPPLPQLKHDMVYHHGGPPTHNSRPHQMGHHGMEGLDMLDPITSSSMTTLAPMGESAPPHHQLHGYGAMNHVMNHHHHGV